MVNVLGIIDKMNELMKPIKEWILKNSNEPVFWLMMFIFMMALYLILHAALEKEK